MAKHATVTARLAYLHPTQVRPYTYMYEPPDGQSWQNCKFDAQPTSIGDARALPHPPSLHREGFELREAPSRVADFRDDDAVKKLYYPEVAALALSATGGKRAFVFDHLVRKREAGRPALTFGRRGNGENPAANGRVHNDYTEDSGRKRLPLVLGQSAPAVRRYSIVNVWRAIKAPIVDTPLAVCDARTVGAPELVAAEVRYPARTGEIYFLEHSPRHRWYYFSQMDRHEALVFKQYDSQMSGVARFVPHSAFDLPDIPPDAPLRESIEARCLVLYE